MHAEVAWRRRIGIWCGPEDIGFDSGRIIHGAHVPFPSIQVLTYLFILLFISLNLTFLIRSGTHEIDIRMGESQNGPW